MRERGSGVRRRRVVRPREINIFWSVRDLQREVSRVFVREQTEERRVGKRRRIAVRTGRSGPARFRTLAKFISMIESVNILDLVENIKHTKIHVNPISFKAFSAIFL